MNELQIFNYNGNEVRTIQKDGEPWWVLKDVCTILELTDTNKTAERLDTDELTRIKFVTGGQNREMICINESGLYNVILRSDKPEAKPFRKWVTSEVLPSIRKHGAFLTEQKIEEILINPDTIINLATALKKEKEKTKALETANAVQQQQIAELKPKADYTDKILNNKGLVNVNQIAKDYGMSAMTFNKILNDLGIQYKQGDQWLLYHKYQSKGYTSSETVDITRSDGRADVKMRTKWTQKGRLFLYNQLKKNGYLPMIERN